LVTRCTRRSLGFRRPYIEPIDERALFEGGMRGMFETLDGYSGYISEDDLAQFNAEIGQHFGGIGIEVAVREDQITVLNPVPGAPAHQAGMLSGDVIVSIDGQSVESANLMDAVKLMRGKVGTKVRVQVRRGEEEIKQFVLTRADIRIDSVRGDLRDEQGVWQFVLAEHPRIGYIRLSSFGDESAEELQAAIKAMRAAGGKGLILDLRGNAGGLLSAAVEISDMFLPPGREIVSTRARDGQIHDQFYAQQPPLLPSAFPLVVLVDRFSASASEIVAACLQDHDRAMIVGERTWGKGTVQNVYPVGAGEGAIRLTTQSYWRPSGRDIHQGSDDTARRLVGRDAQRSEPRRVLDGRIRSGAEAASRARPVGRGTDRCDRTGQGPAVGTSDPGDERIAGVRTRPQISYRFQQPLPCLAQREQQGRG
jgi:carboxyl-terminal processing protease